ncbi:MAG: hypothetical protein ND895_28915 [Pyrinomonadaceae bacterium]|nr:hypothetical protein [Pyrinomonadaceae bacterium]
MKARDNSVTKTIVYAGMLVVLAVVGLTPFVVVSAQSAIGNQTPPATVISSQSPSPSQSADEPSRAVDPVADKYKVIFARSYEGKGSYDSNKPEDNDAFVKATRSEFENFVEQLNTAGAQGYKLVSASYGGLAVGMVKFDGVQYEYDWVMTDQVGSSLSGKDGQYEGLSKRGFRLVDHFEVTIYCDVDSGSGNEYCRTKYVLLLEKQKGVEKPTPYALLWQDSNAKLADDLKQKFGEGFFPTHLFTDNQILIEQTEGKDGRLRDKQDVRAVIGSNVWSGNPSKSKINELAKQGYRLALINNRLALMKRDGKTATPVTYAWVHTTTRKNWKLLPKKRTDFEQKLASLQASGARYRVIYADNQGYTNLIFEQRAPDDGKRYEYKVLTFTFQVDVDAAAQRVSIDLDPASKEKMKTLNSLAKDGFVFVIYSL